MADDTVYYIQTKEEACKIERSFDNDIMDVICAWRNAKVKVQITMM